MLLRWFVTSVTLPYQTVITMLFLVERLGGRASFKKKSFGGGLNPANTRKGIMALWCAGVCIPRCDVTSPAGPSAGRHADLCAGAALDRCACARRGPLCRPRGPPQPVLLCRTLVAGGRAAARSTVRLWMSQLWDLDIRHGSLDCSFVVHSSILLRCFGFLTLILIRF